MVNINCKECGGTGKVLLLNWDTPCNCTKDPQPDQKLQEYPWDSDLMNAWFSPSRKRQHGSVIYLNAEDGHEVEITEVSSKASPCHNDFDLKFVGVVNSRKSIRGGMY